MMLTRAWALICSLTVDTLPESAVGVPWDAVAVVFPGTVMQEHKKEQVPMQASFGSA